MRAASESNSISIHLVIWHDQDRVTLALTTAETSNPFNGNPLEAVAAMPSSSVAPVSGGPNDGLSCPD
jgi:hypothetical protein